MALDADRPDPPSSADTEPEGFGDAIEAAALMLALMTALATVGFQWQRAHERSAQRFAIALVERIARHGERALVPVWSGLGRGPTSVEARHTFQALRGLGPLQALNIGTCRVASRFALCQGTRYHCQVSATTPAGPVQASVGLCSPGARAPYTFDTFDLTVPVTSDDRGNRPAVDIGRDGLIRYGTTAPRPAPLPVRSRQRHLPGTPPL
ncbi:hypothetical protein P7D22_02345 [Lichenihabitans sp. Uapishka_5]|uniref:hypothetical protein n=1 Tax=Lichenihabitans sp. Uapishka_5 TaxID=3037302 RepID=UPI0029E80204|nr:hypothetical protein [Lichenihabitans sp. Uapishka_5]MDX7950015.1 hypothetical protein [Lichenihabitans sp. Uapishka_5]